MSLAYDADELTAGTQLAYPGAGTQIGDQVWKQRIIYGWPSSGGTFATRQLKIKSSCSITVAGRATCLIDYSTNGGGFWQNVYDVAQNRDLTTDTIAISSNQDLTAMKVRVCAAGARYQAPIGSNAGAATLRAYDIRIGSQ